MEGKLIKVDTGWILMVDNKIYASHNDILSLKNCQAIERGYDLDELLKKEIANGKLHPNDGAKKEGIERGIQIALEIFGDKKFSEDDVNGFIDYVIREKHKREGVGTGLSNKELTSANIGVYRVFQEKDIREIYWKEYIQSLQQTQWDVEIEMERSKFIADKSLRNDIKNGFNYTPKFDADGCLILKRV